MSFLRIAALVGVTAILVEFLPWLLRTQPPVITGGYTAPGFEAIADIFRENFESGYDSRLGGSAFAVYYRGEKVVDLWGGYADIESQRKWTDDTVTMAFSTTKGVAAVCLALLAEQGHLDYDKPVAFYWPEFAQKGKDKITVRQMLGHKSGLVVSAPPGYTLDILRDVAASGELMAAAEPQWEVDGQRQGYHMFTYGPLTNELLRRVDPQHRTMATFFREEIMQPFGIDFHIGLPLEETHRAARMRQPDSPRVIQILTSISSYNNRQVAINLLRTTLFLRAVANAGDAIKANFFNDPYNRVLEIPSISGFGTAEALAKLYGILAIGGVDPVTNRTLLAKDGIDAFLDESYTTPLFDQTLGVHRVYNLGMNVVEIDDFPPAFGHMGYGGQRAFADPKYQLGYAFISNYLVPTIAIDDPRSIRLVDSLYECVRKLENK